MSNNPGPWRLGGARHPGEPVYRLPEVARNLGVSAARLAGLMSSHPGLPRWVTIRGRPYYRMSDASRWFAAIPKK